MHFGGNMKNFLDPSKLDPTKAFKQDKSKQPDSPKEKSPSKIGGNIKSLLDPSQMFKQDEPKKSSPRSTKQKPSPSTKIGGNIKNLLDPTKTFKQDEGPAKDDSTKQVRGTVKNLLDPTKNSKNNESKKSASEPAKDKYKFGDGFKSLIKKDESDQSASEPAEDKKKFGDGFKNLLDPTKTFKKDESDQSASEPAEDKKKFGDGFKNLLDPTKTFKKDESDQSASEPAINKQTAVSSDAKNASAAAHTTPTPAKAQSESQPKKVNQATSQEGQAKLKRAALYEKHDVFDKAARLYMEAIDIFDSLYDDEGYEEALESLNKIRDKVTIKIDIKERKKPPVIIETPKENEVHDKKDEEKKKMFGGLGSNLLKGITDVTSTVTDTATASINKVTHKAPTAGSSTATTAASSTPATAENIPFQKDTGQTKGKAPDSDTTPNSAWKNTSPIATPSTAVPAVHASPTKNAEQKKVIISDPVADKKKALDLYNNGLIQFQKKDYEDARKTFAEAIKLIKVPKYGETDKELALIWEYHGDSSFKLAEYGEADISYKRATDLYQKGDQDELKESLARIMLKKGNTQILLGHGSSRAKLYYNVSFQIWETVLEKDRSTEDVTNARLCHSLYNVALLYIKKGEIDVAEKLFKEILDVAEGDTTDDFEVIEYAARANTSIGNIRNVADKYDEAIAHYEAAIELRKQNLEVNKEMDIDDKEEMIGLYNNLGKAYFGKKEPEKAVKFFRKANRILTSGRHKNGLSVAENWVQMGNVRFKEKEYEDARELYNDALRMQNNTLQDDTNLIILRTRHDIALTYCKEKKYDKGLEIMEDILDKVKENEDADLYLIKIHTDMCSAFLKMDRCEDARSHLSSASAMLKAHKLPKDHSLVKTNHKFEIKLMKLSKASEG